MDCNNNDDAALMCLEGPIKEWPLSNLDTTISLAHMMIVSVCLALALHACVLIDVFDTHAHMHTCSRIPPTHMHKLV